MRCEICKAEILPAYQLHIICGKYYCPKCWSPELETSLLNIEAARMVKNLWQGGQS